MVRTSVANLLLTALLLIGAGLRLYNVNWDDGHHVHPDERWITMVAQDMSVPSNLGDALDPRRSTLNPFYNPREGHARHFAYGSFPLYLVRVVATGVSALAGVFPPLADWRQAWDYDHVNLVGRVLSALFDMATILFVLLLGRRVYDARVGLLAAAFLTFTVLHIQLAHFYAFDSVMATFVVAAVYFGVRVAQEGRADDSLLLGAMAALAIASKFSAMPVLAVLVIAHAAQLFAQRDSGQPSAVSHQPASPIPHRAIAGLILSFAVAFIVFAIVSPFALLDFQNFWQSIGGESDMVRGVADLPYTRQYRNTTPVLYLLDNLVQWGMGVPLGLTALAGFVLVLVRAARRRASVGEWVMLAWLLPYVIITSTFMVKFMRYMVLVTPFLCVMAAYILLRIASGKFAIRHSPFAILRYGAIAITLGWTILYALAFMQIYTAPLTRVAASEWIYRNIPEGKTLTAEAWDDPLPFGVILDGRGRSPGEYQIVTMGLHEPDNVAKLTQIKSDLRRADYVVISSNRMYGWLPRLRDRFPITNRYYELLFAEKLGFRLVQTITSYPRLGGFALVDDGADESFTVYDHPQVLIFEKTRSLSDQEWQTLFADLVSVEQPQVVPPQYDKPLLLSQPVDTLPVVADRAWNPLANANPLFAIVVWWLALELVGLIAMPIAFLVFTNLRDRGYLLAKSLGLLIVAYLVWIGASLHLIIYTLPIVLSLLFLLSLFSLLVALRHREALLNFWRAQRPLLLLNEGLFAGAFLLFVFIRFLNPDLWQPWNGGEKHMEFAFLNAILKSPYFPPYDPYYAGGYVNYYYYGQYVVSVVVKLTGITPSVAFNLAVPTLFALTVANAFCVGFNLYNGRPSETRGSEGSLRPILLGLLAAFFVALMGNLDGWTQLVDALGRVSGTAFESSIPGVSGLVRMWPGLAAVLSGHSTMPSYDYWRSTRVIPYTINEFPFFSFLFADLHPHMIGIPFTVLVVAFALNIVTSLKSQVSSKSREDRAAWDMGRETWDMRLVSVLPLALSFGAVAVINTWDLPTYAGLIAGAFFLREYPRQGARALVSALVRAAVVGAIGIGLYWPFFHYYKAFYVGLGRVPDSTPVEPFVVFWGFFLFAAASATLAAFVRQPGRGSLARFVGLTLRRWERAPRLAILHQRLVQDASAGHVLALYGLGASLIATLLLFVFEQPVLAMLFPLVILSALLLFQRGAEPRQAFVSLLFFWGLAVLLGVEIVYLQDFLQGGEYRRMNTVFKFYIQAWVLLGLASAVALPKVWAWVRGWRGAMAWRAAAVVLLAASSIYTLAGTANRVIDRFPGERPAFGTLDGLAYMTVGTYAWPNESSRIELKYDYAAIQWLLENVRGTPVVLEAALGYYREGGLRVASYTGLPTLVGAHQNEQRYGELVGQRESEARELYTTTNVARAAALIAQHRISYIYVGQLERVTYPSQGLEKFETMRGQGTLELVYENPKVRIYRVKEGG